MRAAYATLVTNEDYGLGALALARSLTRVGADAPLLVLATSGAGRLEELEAEGSRIVQAEPLPLSEAFCARHERDRLHKTAPFTKGGKPGFHSPLDNFVKLRLWEQDGFDRIVFLDADAVVLRPIDKLFGYPEFSAAPNLYAELADMHRLNSGVFVAEPSKRTFDTMLEVLDSPDAFWRRTDQTFLESFFPDWHGLPYIYNTLQYIYLNLPDLWRWDAVKVLHYQYEKPWDRTHDKREQLAPLISVWWALLEGRRLPEPIPAPY